MAGEDAFNRAEMAKGIANIQRVLMAAKGAGASAADRAGAEFVNALRDAVSGPSPSSPGSPPGKASGELQGAFDAIPGSDGGGFYIDVTNTAEHAAFLEFGTRFMEPRPYFRTTIDAVTPEIGSFLAEEIIAAEGGA